MVKIAASAMIRQTIPTRPREGSVHGVSITGKATGGPLTGQSLFVFPVRIFRMLDIPQRPAASDLQQDGEIVNRRRRGDGPFERPCVPRIAAGGPASEIRPDQVIDEEQYRH